MLIYFNPNLLSNDAHSSLRVHLPKSDHPSISKYNITPSCVILYQSTHFPFQICKGEVCTVLLFSMNKESENYNAQLIASAYDHTRKLMSKALDECQIIKRVVKAIDMPPLLIIHDFYSNSISILSNNNPHQCVPIFHGLTVTSAQAIALDKHDMPKDVVHVISDGLTDYFVTWYESGVTRTTFYHY